MRAPGAAAALALAASLLVAGAAALRSGPALAEAPPAFRVIVNAANPASAVDRRFLADVFLKKVTRWPHDAPARPVDLADDSPVRRRFSDDVLKRSVPAVKAFWQQAIFSGRNIPPPELESDEQVIRFVLRNAGGIGYVSGAANLTGTKVLTVR